jgi:hypothetical protein
MDYLGWVAFAIIASGAIIIAGLLLADLWDRFEKS